MIKFISLIVFIALIGPIQVFAEDACRISLSPAESNEDQDIIIMSSLMASQLQPVKLPMQINLTILFLSTLTEVKIGSQDKRTFHHLSLIDRTLFNVFKQLGILEDIQTFLLSQLGLSSDDLGPFSIRDSGGLTLHLNTPPSVAIRDLWPLAVNLLMEIQLSASSSIMMANYFNYDESTEILFKKIRDIKRRALWGPAFAEALLLAALEFRNPLRSFLFDALNTKNVVKIKSDLYKSLAKLRRKKSRGFYSKYTMIQGEPEQENDRVLRRQGKFLRDFSKEEIDRLIQGAILLFQEEDNMTDERAAKRLGITRYALHKLLNKHEEENGDIPGRKRRPRRMPSIDSSEDERDEITQEAPPYMIIRNY